MKTHILCLTFLFALIANAQTPTLLPPRWIALPESRNGTVVLHYNNSGIDAEYYEVQRKLPMWRWVTKGKATPQDTTWTDTKPSSRDWSRYRMRAVRDGRKGAWNKPVTFYQ